MDLPLLPTTVVGSWPVPEWLERIETDHLRRRVSGTQLAEVHDWAVTAAIKDQELAGLDIVSDGELRRDNDVDYLLARIPGIELAGPAKDFAYDYHGTRVRRSPSPPATDPGLGLDADLAFTRARTDRPIKFSFTGPFSLSRRVVDDVHADPADLVRAIAHVLAGVAATLRDAGADLLQIDEPFLAGHPEQVGLAVDAVNIVTRDVDVPWALHVCYGNRYARPLWEGHYDFLFPAVLDAHVDQLVLEFARKGDEDLPVIERSGWDRAIGLGVVDVKSPVVETPELVSTRIERALDLVPPERLMINPDCGLRHLPTAVAVAKLRAMVDGAAKVRARLIG
ncbi:methionine synthase [Actinomycetospora sp. TBRC 11914]|uniref:methionine synthase n=1 Tax=Actinomycetospora sp. TBRC 11914 TaxID=2729387 RepID=UPI00145D4D3B|nr:methionine synthase [Actinomycetospora sp. TBRC 11914]NMO94118.1 methionine synthase [Actinomycetospora sp. TBRC 11914]